MPADHPTNRPDVSWRAMPLTELAALRDRLDGRWWLSGGVAVEVLAGRSLRPQPDLDLSVTASDARAFLGSLGERYQPWVLADGQWRGLAHLPEGTAPEQVHVFDADEEAWCLDVHLEDGTADRWLYRRDPRLQLPWEQAVVERDGLPVSAPQVQLVWKAFAPRPEDEADRAACEPLLTAEQRAWFERAILTVHPHSQWAIERRSPASPAKASWLRR